MSGDAQIDDLLAKVLETPEILESGEVTDEQVLELQKRLNPYGPSIETPGTEKVRRAALSITNLREGYSRRFAMTALVGFVFRMLSEYEPPAETRRWTSKSGGSLAAEEEAARAAARPFTADELLAKADALRELALLAKEAETASNDAVAVAKKAEEAATVDRQALEIEGGDAKAEAAAKQKETAANRAFITADAALAKARGLIYAATHELRIQGQQADVRIDVARAEAARHTSLEDVLARERPLDRPTPGQIEVPAKVAKSLIKDFLDSYFEYNPDAHVRKAYDEVPTKSANGARVDAGDEGRPLLSEIRKAAPIEDLSAEELATFRAATADVPTLNAFKRFLRDEEATAALGVALRDTAKFKSLLEPVPEDSPARAAVTTIPPADTFHRLEFYTSANYETLRTATESIYADKPDLDSAIHIYDVFEGTEAEVDDAFRQFRDRNEDTIRSDLLCVDFNAWVLLGAWSGNRDKVDFYNKKTELLRRIIQRHQEDRELGKDLMEKRVVASKAENIRRDGPDAPGLAEYAAQNPSLTSAGVKQVISAEQRKRLERANGDLKAAKELEHLDECRATIRDLEEQMRLRELTTEETRRLADTREREAEALRMLEVPDDAIQVDVFTHDAKSGSFGRKHFYTKAEEPTTPEAPVPGAPLSAAAAAAAAAGKSEV